MKFQLTNFNRNIPDEELLNDLKRVAQALCTTKLSSRAYDANGGKYRSSTIGDRFGGWNNALKRVSLELVQRRDVLELDLFSNLETVWISIGSQPVFRDMKPPLSKYSTHQYNAKFGTWRNALEAFVAHINRSRGEEVFDEKGEEPIRSIKAEKAPTYKHKTKRTPSARLKVQVLMRDGNKCRLCGITVVGRAIHFDHIVSWSKGGETVLENLQVLCSEHNFAKGDL